MKTLLNISFLFLLSMVIWSCNSGIKSKDKIDKRTTVAMETDYGTMIIELYDETPLHRDNFIKLVNDSVYDSLLFHRVIEEFMIQGGDIDSKTSLAGDTLGDGDFPYLINAEFNSAFFHKKGALAAARTGNPERASSSTQFYIVQGKVHNDSLLDVAQERINNTN
jgi:cyclophilin family peptidyl-prolyl cis-trans isomerase